MLFLDNCNEFAELVRTGDLDFYLLKPIDEQFLITLPQDRLVHGPERADGRAVMGAALCQMDWQFDPVQVAALPGHCSSAARPSPTASCCC